MGVLTRLDFAKQGGNVVGLQLHSDRKGGAAKMPAVI